MLFIFHPSNVLREELFFYPARPSVSYNEPNLVAAWQIIKKEKNWIVSVFPVKSLRSLHNAFDVEAKQPVMKKHRILFLAGAGLLTATRFSGCPH